MLQENINFLHNYNPSLLEVIKQTEDILQNSSLVSVVDTKTELPTVLVNKNNAANYIHSKYDPKKEAETFIAQYVEQIDNYNHIFFYGIGLGYHVEEMMTRYPEKTFSIYEPIPEIFYQYMSNRELTTLPVKQLKHICIEWSQEHGSMLIDHIGNELGEDVLLVVLPSYERIFASEYVFFKTVFKEKLQQKKISIGADVVFSKRWTLNALMNLPYTLTSPNLLTDKKDVFKGKPVLLVAAGPSLEDEIENLRHIKNNKLAYIFAVGSANKALIANGILPDAVCTYDPQGGNFGVFKEIIERGYDQEIPMVYGTTVGFETLERYHGPKLHFLTSQDTVTPYFLDYDVESLPYIEDSFSIAIVTFQILAKLEVSQVILVGQNFAFRNNKFYSSGISYGEGRPTEVQEKDLVDKLYVTDVNGGQIETNQPFNQMRLLLERYIEIFKELKVVNTTKDGAAIKGAPFRSLDEVITKELTSKVVETNWYNTNNSRKFDAKKQIDHFNQEISQFKKILFEFEEAVKVIEKNANKGRLDINNTPKLYKEYERNYQSFYNSEVYQRIIKPVLRVETELFEKKLQAAIDVKDHKTITAETLTYIELCRRYFIDYTSLIQVKVYPRLQRDDVKFYSSLQNRDVFKTSGLWKPYNDLLMNQTKERPFFRVQSLSCNEKGSSIEFKFTGNSIRIIASTRKNYTSKLAIIIDGKKEFFSTRDMEITENEIPNRHVIVYEKNELENSTHHVRIELLNNNEFVFEGVEVNSFGRLLHVDEVTKAESLEIGKRIRCYYDNETKTYSNLGNEGFVFLPYHLKGTRKGSFYLVMIKHEVDGTPLMIADRDINELTSEFCLYKIIDNKVIKTELVAKTEFITEGRKKYQHNCGAIKYTGSWERKSLFEVGNYLKEHPYTISCTETQTKGDKLSFQFEGIAFRIIGKFPSVNGIKMKINKQNVDVQLHNDQVDFTIKKNVNKENSIEVKGLKDELYFVEIELTDNKRICINSIEINGNGRLYHPDEVTKVEQLEIGKRIRCHYKASYNEVGVFSGLGVETNNFIPPESSANPNGDFYFIMVDRDKEGKTKLIADRNVQHSISWNELQRNNLVDGTLISIDKHFKAAATILTGGKAYLDKKGNPSLFETSLGVFPTDNEYDSYIIRNDLNRTFIPNDKNVWNWDNIFSWCKEIPTLGKITASNGIEVEFNTERRVVRGHHSRKPWGSFGAVLKTSFNKTVGFRPIITYISE